MPEGQAFLYVALFAAIRQFIGRFKSSNPTWIKKAGDDSDRIPVSRSDVEIAFAQCALSMKEWLLQRAEISSDAKAHIEIASSDHLPIPNESVDLILSSPPYCTRLDYAVATFPELAVLGATWKTDIRDLRSKMIGTPTICQVENNPTLGSLCEDFLDYVYNHPSKASASYYFKTYNQYFKRMYNSVREISRVTKRHGVCVLVVQDSFYKERQVRLPQILIEIFESFGFELSTEQQFVAGRSLTSINPSSASYSFDRRCPESVLFLQKR
ncbi:DNA methylase [compost metagenome]